MLAEGIAIYIMSLIFLGSVCGANLVLVHPCTPRSDRARRFPDCLRSRHGPGYKKLQASREYDVVVRGLVCR